AHDLGIDRLELRRRNMVTSEDLPFRTPLGLTYDHGDFAKTLDEALRAADWVGFPARRAAAARRGRLRGIGMAHYVERVAGGWAETAELRIAADGKATAF